jgi:hypothetical protein
MTRRHRDEGDPGAGGPPHLVDSVPMSSRYRRRHGATMGIATVGLLVGHWFAYTLASPHTEARRQMLEGSGHSYLGVAFQLAASAAVVGLLFLALWRTLGRGPRSSWSMDAATLVVVQASLFIGLEFGERIVSGAPFADLVEGPLLAYGLLAQALLAPIGATILWLTERSAVAVGSTGTATSVPPPPALSVVVVAANGPGHRRSSAVALGSRAPPIPG